MARSQNVSYWYILQYATALHERVNFGVVVCGPHSVLISSDTSRLALINPNAAEAAQEFAADIMTMERRLNDAKRFRTWIDEWRLRLLGVIYITKGAGSLMPIDDTLLRICREALHHPTQAQRDG